jgi:hypothetical protein
MYLQEIVGKQSSRERHGPETRYFTGGMDTTLSRAHLTSSYMALCNFREFREFHDDASGTDTNKIYLRAGLEMARRSPLVELRGFRFLILRSRRRSLVGMRRRLGRSLSTRGSGCTSEPAFQYFPTPRPGVSRLDFVSTNYGTFISVYFHKFLFNSTLSYKICFKNSRRGIMEPSKVVYVYRLPYCLLRYRFIFAIKQIGMKNPYVIRMYSSGTRLYPTSSSDRFSATWRGSRP